MFTTFMARFSSDVVASVHQPPSGNGLPLDPPREAALPADDFDLEIDPEADAAATLEFLSMGRSRAKTTGALVGIGVRGALGADEGSESGDARSRESSAAPEPRPAAAAPATLAPPCRAPAAAALRQPGTSARPAGKPSDPSSRQRPTYAANLLRELPAEAVGRRLVEYDTTMVAWLHCAVHVPTFLAECELFWEEGAQGEVEVNKTWLALLFAVLASALHHLPSAEARALFPDESVHSVLSRWFDAIQQALHEAKWLANHSLYSVQVLAVSVSLYNHLGQTDLYFTQLAAAVKIAQTLNLNHLGADSYPSAASATQLDPRALIVREVCKRAWWQLVIQGAPCSRLRSCAWPVS